MGYSVTESNLSYQVSDSSESYQVSEYDSALNDFSSLMSFWSDTFDFTNNVLTDKSGNNNDVPLVASNCVNFINDVTITLSIPQVGSSISELNESSGDTTGISVNGAGHIAIDQSELTNVKIWQFKLDTGDEFFLTGGINNYVFCDSSLYGTLGGTEDTDWEWETTNSYFRNLQYGYSLNVPLFNLVPVSVLNWPSYWFNGQFARTDADTITYTGINGAGSNSYFEYQSILRVGQTYEIKLTVSESTENFEYNSLQLIYTNTSAKIYDNDGAELYKNGEHIITITCNNLTRITFRMSDSGKDYSGRSLKCYVNYCKEIDSSLLIPAYDTSYDTAGNALTVAGSTSRHNGCEVQLDFSGITGVTDANGDSYAPPSDYTFSDSLTNPMFKRIAYDNDLNEIESDYIIFTEFLNGTNLSEVLTLLKEKNMLIRRFSSKESNDIFVIQKYDANYDLVTIFSKVGYNSLYSIAQFNLVTNTKQLPVSIDYDDVYPINHYSDRIGPYYLSGIGWIGGGHQSPNTNTPDANWEEIMSADDTEETVTVADSSFFPDPPDGKVRLCTQKYWTGSAYASAAHNKYTKSGNVFVLTNLNDDYGIDLSNVVSTVGDPNPPYQTYQYQTAHEESKTINPDVATWTACNSVTVKVSNNIEDYTQTNKDTLVGVTIIDETVNYKITQEAPNVSINYSGAFLGNGTITLYYGLQGIDMAVDGADGRIYFAHGQDDSMQTDADLNSGTRSSYPCEKVVKIYDVTDNDSAHGVTFMDLSYGTPAAEEATNPYWSTTGGKVYFRNIDGGVVKISGDMVTWRGGMGILKNYASTQYVIAYYSYENGALYFIVDFTDSLTFGSINEVFEEVSGRVCEVVYKDGGISIADSPGDSFTIPNTGLDLTATASGNIKFKIT